MIDSLPRNECCGCSACLQVCPKECISLTEDIEGFFYPKINTALCVQCNLCEKVCPASNKSFSKQSFRDVYAALNDSAEKRNNSSSGGVFIQLAENTVKKGGIVFGAKWDDDWSVVHDYSKNLSGLAGFQGSKYSQSIIGNSYEKAEEFLKLGIKVLFSGTPCQIAGLKGYLRREYENLFTVECVCHGVPSPGLWRRYLKEQSRGRKVTYVNHRYKGTGWRNYSALIQYSDGTEDRIEHDRNSWIRAFIKNLTLRPSCYNCSFKCVNSLADITLGDFWGIEKIYPEMNDDKGVSMIVIHSPKGKNELSETHFIRRVSVEDAARYNGALFLSATENPLRSRFFTRVQNEPFVNVVSSLARDSFFLTIKRALRRLLISKK